MMLHLFHNIHMQMFAETNSAIFNNISKMWRKMKIVTVLGIRIKSITLSPLKLSMKIVSPTRILDKFHFSRSIN